MNKMVLGVLVVGHLHAASCCAETMSRQEIMHHLKLDAGGKTEVVKNFPDSFPDILTARGEPIVYTKENSNNFEYIGMPVGGLCAGQLYLGGDGKLWFWDIFNLNYRRGQLKGEEAYQYPYQRRKPEEKGARMIEQGFSIRVKGGGRDVTKTLDRDGIRDIAFLGQYPMGEVTYRDPDLPVEVKLEAFSPFVPLDLDRSLLPATVLSFSIKNIATETLEAELSGWLENAVLIASRKKAGLQGVLVNRPVKMAGVGLRMEYAAVPTRNTEQKVKRPDILFEDFESGYGRWQVEGEAFGQNGIPYYHHQPLHGHRGERIADSFKDASDLAQGGMISRAFVIERDYIQCLVGGGNDNKRLKLEVKVDGRVIATASGDNSETLKPVFLDMHRYQGKEAVIEIHDRHSAGWGHILVDHIVFTDTDPQLDLLTQPDFGTLSLAMLDGTGESLARPEEALSQDLRSPDPLLGKLARHVTLAPGAEARVEFILTWHFPHTQIKTPKDGARYYGQQYEDAFAVSDFVIDNFEELTSTTRLWRDVWYDSTLPYWFLDRTFLNTSILASSTSTLLSGRLFYGWEGGYQGHGTCTHVWGYVQAMGRLFPELEKSLREQVDFVPLKEKGAMTDDGLIHFRWWTSGLAVDGQSGCILRTLLVHQMSPDSTFLKRVYPGVKRAMQGLTEARDADHDGILTGPQHNTLDADWYGKITWLSLHYTAALRATAEMADEMGDHPYAAFCHQTADKGRHFIENHLFNGEYFFHEADPAHPKSPGTYRGLEYSQLLGQSWAYQVGLGEIIDPVKVKMALESMWRYNFTTDVGPFREVHKGGRWYAMPGEGGLIACTWPRGGSEVLEKGNKRFAAYNNECQNGYEYAATSLMMWHDMPYHSLAHIWTLHNDRYHGSKRNPWCEIEWGLHYSRSMASYGHFVAACGFEYHGPKGTMAFAPKMTPDHFKAPFTAAEGWGSFTQQRLDSRQTNTLVVRYGQLALQTLALEIPEGRNLRTIDLKLGDKTKRTVAFEQRGSRVSITLAERNVLTAPQMLFITLHY